MSYINNHITPDEELGSSIPDNTAGSTTSRSVPHLMDASHVCDTIAEAKSLAYARQKAYAQSIAANDGKFTALPPRNTADPATALKYVPGQTLDQYLDRRVSADTALELKKNDPETYAYLSGDNDVVLTPTDVEADIAHYIGKLTKPVLAWATDANIWMTWAGNRWIVDPKGGERVVQRLLTDTRDRKAIVRPYKNVPAYAQKKASFDKFILAGEAYRTEDDIIDINTGAPFVPWETVTAVSTNSVERIAKAIQYEGTLDVKLADFDQDPTKLGTPNGTLHVLTGELTSPDPADMITKLTRAKFWPKGAPASSVFTREELEESMAYKPGMWENTVKEILNDDEDLVKFIQQSFGAYLSPTIKFRYILGLIGKKGRNGKSTIVESVSTALGDYATTLKSKVITSRETPDYSLMPLRGARMGSISEVNKYTRLNPATVKTLVGTDTVTDRDPYTKPVTWRPTHKLVYSANHLPLVDTGENAFWDRFLHIPFEHRYLPQAKYDREMSQCFTEEEKSRLHLIDPMLEEALQTPIGRAMVLGWLVEGAVSLINDDGTINDVEVPSVVQVETDQAQRVSNPFAIFANRVFDVSDNPTESIPAGVVFAMWYRYKTVYEPDPAAPPKNTQGIDVIEAHTEARYVTGNRTAQVVGLTPSDLGKQIITELMTEGHMVHPKMAPSHVAWVETYVANHVAGRGTRRGR